MTNLELLTGKTKEHLIYDQIGQKYIHQKILPSLNQLRLAAQNAGFTLEVASGFRDFEQQLKIWNLKATGQRTLLDTNSNPLDFKTLSPKEIVYAILRWSALPGASRHHWGTDIDVYDSKNISPEYKVQLIPQETIGDGPFAAFHLWLDDNLEQFDFFRPYSIDRGGIAPEKWHISYRPLADVFMNDFSYEKLRETIKNTDLELKTVVLDELPEIYQRFVLI